MWWCSHSPPRYRLRHLWCTSEPAQLLCSRRHNSLAHRSLSKSDCVPSMHTLYCRPESCIHRLNSLSAHTLDTVFREVYSTEHADNIQHPSTVERLKHCPFCPFCPFLFSWHWSALVAPWFGLGARFLRCLKDCLKVHSTVCLATQRSILRSHPCAFKRMSKHCTWMVSQCQIMSRERL